MKDGMKLEATIPKNKALIFQEEASEMFYFYEAFQHFFLGLPKSVTRLCCIKYMATCQ